MPVCHAAARYNFRLPFREHGSSAPGEYHGGLSAEAPDDQEGEHLRGIERAIDRRHVEIGMGELVLARPIIAALDADVIEIALIERARIYRSSAAPRRSWPATPHERPRPRLWSVPKRSSIVRRINGRSTLPAPLSGIESTNMMARGIANAGPFAAKKFCSSCSPTPSGLQHHHGGRREALGIVRERRHRDVGDVGMLEREVLDLLGIDVLAAADEHVVDAGDVIVRSRRHRGAGYRRCAASRPGCARATAPAG